MFIILMYGKWYFSVDITYSLCLNHKFSSSYSGTRNSTSLTTSGGSSLLTDQYPITKTHSVSSVFTSKAPSSFDNRNSLNSLDNNSHMFQYSKRFVSGKNSDSSQEVRYGSVQSADGKGRNSQAGMSRQGNGREKSSGRRNSSIENLNSDGADTSNAASLKKVKYESQVGLNMSHIYEIT